jgi:Protein of unknown function (DUF2971)
MLLYHYTMQRGLIGIANSRSIWASSIEFLNDRSEYRHALDFFRVALLGESVQAPQPIANWLVAAQNMACGPGEQAALGMFEAPFVTSFSEAGDLLSQWRGYCGPRGGFSLGFEAEAVEKIVASQGCKLFRCIYDDATKTKLVQNRVSQLVAALTPLAEDDQVMASSKAKRDEIFASFQNDVMNMSPRFKHESFSEEREWRIVRPFGLADLMLDHPVSFREGAPGPVPYVEVNLAEKGKLPLSEVVLSPGTEPVCSGSVGHLLNGVVLGFQVRPSAIPLR